MKTMITLQCWICGEMLGECADNDARGLEDLRGAATELAWNISGKRILCAECAQEREDHGA